MSANYYIANATKRQFFDPFDFDHHGSHRDGVLDGTSGVALAKLLLPSERLGFHLDSWIGDGMVVASDYEQSEKLIRLPPFSESDQCLGDIFAGGFKNITLNLMAHLCTNGDHLEYFLSFASQCDRGFVNLVHIVIYLDAPAIEKGLVERFGRNWRTKYNESLKNENNYHPLPFTRKPQITKR